MLNEPAFDGSDLESDPLYQIVARCIDQSMKARAKSDYEDIALQTIGEISDLFELTKVPEQYDGIPQLKFSTDVSIQGLTLLGNEPTGRISFVSDDYDLSFSITVERDKFDEWPIGSRYELAILEKPA